MFSSSITSSVAKPWVMLTGLPPNVLKWMRFVITARRYRVVVVIAPSGAPLPIPLAMVTISGRHPSFDEPNSDAPFVQSRLGLRQRCTTPPCCANDSRKQFESTPWAARHRSSDPLDRLADETSDFAGRLVLNDFLSGRRHTSNRRMGIPDRRDNGNSSRHAYGERWAR